MIKIVQLINSDEILADVVENETSVKLTNPLRCLSMPDDSGKVNLRFIPYIMYGKDDCINIDKRHIVCQYTPQDEISSKYTQFFSGIVQPNGTKIIIPSPTILTE